MSQNDQRPSWRKPAGMLAIMLLITIWVFAIVSLSSYIGQIHILAQAFVYLVAGIVWIAPLRPLMIWMETGSFKAPPEV
jgi:glycerol-3-phosphate acyltransferase PlsY